MSCLLQDGIGDLYNRRPTGQLVLLSIYRATLGDHNCAALSADEFKNQFAPANLFRKHASISPESDFARIDECRLKVWTLRARRTRTLKSTHASDAASERGHHADVRLNPNTSLRR